MKPKCIMFDCDTLMLQMEVLCYRALNRVMSPYGVKYSWRRFYEQLRDTSGRDLIAQVIKQHQLALELPRLHNEFDQVFSNLVQSKIVSKEKIEHSLYLLDKAGYQVCITTNQPSQKVSHILDTLSVKLPVFSAYELACWKPDPDLYIYASMQLGIPVQDCFVIYDNCLAEQAIHSAGIKGATIQAMKSGQKNIPSSHSLLQKESKLRDLAMNQSSDKVGSQASRKEVFSWLNQFIHPHWAY